VTPFFHLCPGEGDECDEVIPGPKTYHRK
jgi:hypothetical protein